jgi:hypothetical protein
VIGSFNNSALVHGGRGPIKTQEVPMPKVYFIKNTICPDPDAEANDLGAREAAAGTVRDVSKTLARTLIDAKKARMATTDDLKASKTADPPKASSK